MYIIFSVERDETDNPKFTNTTSWRKIQPVLITFKFTHAAKWKRPDDESDQRRCKAVVSRFRSMASPRRGFFEPVPAKLVVSDRALDLFWLVHDKRAWKPYNAFISRGENVKEHLHKPGRKRHIIFFCGKRHIILLQSWMAHTVYPKCVAHLVILLDCKKRKKWCYRIALIIPRIFHTLR